MNIPRADLFHGHNPAQLGTVNDVICVDFDRTLMDHENVAPGHKMGYPEQGAVEALELLSRKYKIVILTSRTPAQHRIVEQWLNYFNIPFDRVTNVKPEAIAYIDDRAVRYQDNWPQIVEWLHTLDTNPEARI